MSDVHTVAAIALKKNENSFGIVTSKRQYYVRASNPKEMQEWIDALKEAKEQIRQRSTMTQDMAAMELATSSGGENPSGPASRQRQASTSPNLMPVDRQNSVKGGGNNATPINIVIPGKGLYTSPAQARQNSTGTSTMSPLTATSDSEAGTATGAEQFGMSYASSTGQSMAGSPGRGGVMHHFDHSSGGRQSPQSFSGGDETSEGLRRSKRSNKTASGIRDASIGSSGGEGSAGVSTGWTAAGGKSQSQASQQQQQQQQHAVLSSSDEDGEGEDWDEDEVADRAMPLPGSTGIGAVHASHGTQLSGPAPAIPSGSGDSGVGKPKMESEFLKDPNKVIHQGYLMKQSNRRKQWRKRWFILTSSHLSYTRSHMNGKPHRQIPLTSILDAIEYTSKKATNQLQSSPPPPSSPSLQSPSLNANSISFQLGSTQDNTAASGGIQKEGLTNDGNNGTAPTSDILPERRGSSVTLGTSPVPQPKRKKENCFKIITPKRTYVVCAPTEEEEIKWLSALQALLAHWRGSKEAETETAPALSTSSTAPQPTPSQPSTGTNNPLNIASRPLRRGNTNEDISSAHGQQAPPPL